MATILQIMLPVLHVIWGNQVAINYKYNKLKQKINVDNLQAFNWLMRSATQPTCLHDLFWHFIASLTPQPAEREQEEEEEEEKKKEKKEQDIVSKFTEHWFCHQHSSTLKHLCFLSSYTPSNY